MDEFDKFIENVKLNFNTFLKNTPFWLLFSGQLLCKMQYYYDKTSTEVSKIEFLASQSHPHQPIKETTHVLQNTSTKYLSLPLNVEMESGVHPFLLPNFHYRIIYAKFNLEIHWKGNLALFKSRVDIYQTCNQQFQCFLEPSCKWKEQKKVLIVKRRIFDEYCRINEHTKI